MPKGKLRILSVFHENINIDIDHCTFAYVDTTACHIFGSCDSQQDPKRLLHSAKCSKEKPKSLPLIDMQGKMLYTSYCTFAAMQTPSHRTVLRKTRRRKEAAKYVQSSAPSSFSDESALAVYTAHEDQAIQLSPFAKNWPQIICSPHEQASSHR